MATDIIRVDVIEHKAPGGSGAKGKIKTGGGDVKTKCKTPEEQREAQEKKAARDKARADQARSRLIKSTIVYGAMAVRKAAQIGGEIANMTINQSYTRQIFDAQMSGDTRRSQILQNKKTKANSVTSFVTTNVNSIASSVAGFAINPYLGAIQLVTYLTQFSLDIMNQYQQALENTRQYKAQQERALAQSEYARRRLLTNTFNNRGFL